MNILFVGDIVGKPGRAAVRNLLSQIVTSRNVDFVIANGENAAGGMGITPSVAEELFELGIDVITMGNHVWDKKESMQYYDEQPRILRPLNYPPGAPGRGSAVFSTRSGQQIAVINVAGRVFSPVQLDCPFRTLYSETERLAQVTPVILVDFHAEATSEKVAMGWFLQGRVSAVIGTHTHVQTADARILPKGTAYITDVGMTGPAESVIGIKPELIIKRFVTQLPTKFEVASGPRQLEGVVINIDEDSGKALSVEALSVKEP